MTDIKPIEPVDPAITQKIAEPPKPTQKVVEPPKVAKTKLELEKEELLKKIGDTLGEFGGHESDIPLNHNYWNLVAKFRAL